MTPDLDAGLESAPRGRLRDEPPGGPHATAGVRRREPARLVGDAHRAGREARPAVVPWSRRPGVRERARRSVGRRARPVGQPLFDRGVRRADAPRDSRGRPSPVRRDDGSRRRGTVRPVPDDALLRPPGHGRPGDVHLRRSLRPGLGACRSEWSRPGRSSRRTSGHPGRSQQGERRPPALRPRGGLARAVTAAAPRVARSLCGPRGHGRPRRVAALALRGGEPVDGGAQRRRRSRGRSPIASCATSASSRSGSRDGGHSPSSSSRSAERSSRSCVATDRASTSRPWGSSPWPFSSPRPPSGIPATSCTRPSRGSSSRRGGFWNSSGGPPLASAFRRAARVTRSWVGRPPSPSFPP